MGLRKEKRLDKSSKKVLPEVCLSLSKSYTSVIFRQNTWKKRPVIISVRNCLESGEDHVQANSNKQPHLVSHCAAKPPGQVSPRRVVMSSPIRVLCSLGEKYLGVLFPVPLRVGLVSRPLWAFSSPFFFFFFLARIEEKVNR